MMDDSEQAVENAFVQSILASPLDRLPRLVYADWLDERSDPRAEHLRLQCQVVAALERLAELSGSLPAEWAKQVDLLSQAIIVFRMPHLGETIERATVRAHLAKPGQRLVLGDDLVDVETDKACLAVPVEHHCVVLAYLVNPGQSVPIDAPLALLLRV